MQRIVHAVVGLCLVLACPTLAAADDSPPSPSDRGSYGTPARGLERARSRIEKGDYESATRTLEKFVEKNPEDADAWNLLGYASRKLERFEKAEAAYDKALAIEPDHKGALEYRGELYLQTGRPDEARGALARLEALCPSGCSELSTLREAFEREGVETATAGP
ncbi:MAG: tetratricopeptide repeat protein [Myxococcota bacterium]|nr:tetratricopeptide repeat protein [Myxococcota bacterium]